MSGIENFYTRWCHICYEVIEKKQGNTESESLGEICRALLHLCSLKFMFRLCEGIASPNALQFWCEFPLALDSLNIGIVCNSMDF